MGYLITKNLGEWQSSYIVAKMEQTETWMVKDTEDNTHALMSGVQV